MMKKNEKEVVMIPKKLTDADTTMYCAACGSSHDIQLWPHRDKEGRMVGLVAFCKKCQTLAANTTCTWTLPRAPFIDRAERLRHG